MLLRDLSGVLHEALVDIKVFVVVTVVVLKGALGTLVFIIPAHNFNLHAIEHSLQ